MTQEQINKARAEQAEEEFESEVRRYQSLVLGNSDLKPPKLKGRAGESLEERVDQLEAYAGQIHDYTGTLESVIKTFIRQNVKHMRGIALMGMKVDEKCNKAFNLAGEANNAAQKMIEVHGARQMAAHQAFQDIKDIFDMADLEAEVLCPDSAAAKDMEAVQQDFLEAEKILIERAAKAGLIPEEQANQMLANTMRVHGEAMAHRAAAEPEQKFTDRLIKRGRN